MILDTFISWLRRFNTNEIYIYEEHLIFATFVLAYYIYQLIISSVLYDPEYGVITIVLERKY